MKKEIFIDGVAEYLYEKSNEIHRLYYNNGSQWTQDTRNTLALEIIDTGDGFKISQKTPQAKKNNFNYSEALYLTILLKIVNKDYNFEIADKIKF